MKETMLTYIFQEREILKYIIENRKINLRKYIDYISSNRINNWVVLATGSSANAMLCAKYYVESIVKVSVDFKTVLPFTYYDQKLKDDTLVFAVSQSGRSYSTIKALQKAKNAHCFTLTANEDSPIAKISDEIINIGCGEEKVGYVTKGFSATVLTFMLIGLETAKLWKRISEDEYNKKIKELESAIDRIDDVIDRTINWYKNYKDKLIGCKHFIAIGYGPSIGVISEFNTKFTETLRVSVNAHELEEYMHGPYLALKEDQSIIFIETNNELEERQNKLKNYIERFTNNCYKVSYVKEDCNPKTLCLDLNFDELVLPILMVVPVQYLAYQIAVDINSDFLTDKFDGFGKTMGSKLRG